MFYGHVFYSHLCVELRFSLLPATVCSPAVKNSLNFLGALAVFYN